MSNGGAARALPVLDRGGYIAKRDLRAELANLRASAPTYVAGALASLLSLSRWIRFPRWRTGGRNAPASCHPDWGVEFLYTGPSSLGSRNSL